MTALLTLFLSLLVFSSGSPNAKLLIAPTMPQRVVQTFDPAFSVQNLTSVNVGWVTIHLADNSYAYINVTGSGTFSASLAAQASECSIHGQFFVPGMPTRIIIDAHTSVRVTWTGNVIVVDVTETY